MSFKLLLDSRSRLASSQSSSNFSIQLPSPFYINDYDYIRLTYAQFYNTIYNVTTSNNFIDVKISSSTYSANITPGVYNANTFGSALQTALTAAISNTWTVTYNSNQLTYTIGGASNFQLLFSSGTHAAVSMWRMTGFASSNGLTGIDTTNGTSTTSTQVVNFSLPLYFYINLTNICADKIFTSDGDSFSFVIPLDASSGSIVQYDSLSNFPQYLKRPDNLNVINNVSVSLTSRSSSGISLNGSEFFFILEFTKKTSL